MSSANFGETNSAIWVGFACPGEGADYRLPYSLVANLSAGDTIPEGYMLLWDNTNSRIVPLVTFKYLTEHTITLEAPDGTLTAGQRYRLLVPGTSIAEAVGYLLMKTWDDEHNGLTASGNLGTACGSPTYSKPLSHDNLIGLYTGAISTTFSSDYSRHYYRASSYPLNPHPQYLHRYGYMANDNSGNNANAMRGHLVFAGTYNAADSTKSLIVATSGTAAAGNKDETYGVFWGGCANTVPTITGSPSTSLQFLGGSNLAWPPVLDPPSTHASKFGFDTVALGALPSGPAATKGALVYTPHKGTPLYLRGSFATSTALAAHSGAYLGFDYGVASGEASYRNEMNYIKLVDAYRPSSATADVPNLPATTLAHLTTPLNITPSLSARLNAYQIREFRFRAGSYVSNATNAGLGAASTEFAKYFTSPAIVGADFFNVYSNAIFFSNQGDGKQTSFNQHGTTWLSGGGPTTPAGLYYYPEDTLGASYKFYSYEDSAEKELIRLGDSVGTEISISGPIDLVSGEDAVLTSAGLASIMLQAGHGSLVGVPVSPLIQIFTGDTTVVAAEQYIGIGQMLRGTGGLAGAFDGVAVLSGTPAAKAPLLLAALSSLPFCLGRWSTGDTGDLLLAGQNKVSLYSATDTWVGSAGGLSLVAGTGITLNPGSSELLLSASAQTIRTQCNLFDLNCTTLDIDTTGGNITLNTGSSYGITTGTGILLLASTAGSTLSSSANTSVTAEVDLNIYAKSNITIHADSNYTGTGCLLIQSGKNYDGGEDLYTGGGEGDLRIVAGDGMRIYAKEDMYLWAKQFRLLNFSYSAGPGTSKHYLLIDDNGTIWKSNEHYTTP
jgi:hypothetical protein